MKIETLEKINKSDRKRLHETKEESSEYNE